MSKALKNAKKYVAAASDADADESKKLLSAAIEELRDFSIEAPVESLPVYRDAAAIARTIDSKLCLAESLSGVGFCQYLVSDHDHAAPTLTEALDLFEEVGDRAGAGRARGALASVHVSQGDFERGFKEAFEALQIMREVGDKRLVGWLLQGIGNAYADLGDFDRAIRYNQEALDIFRENDFTIGEGRALNGLGSAYQGMEEYEKAREYHLQALELLRAADNKLGEARALNDLGVIHQKLGEFDDARECHEKALALRDDTGNKQAKSTSLINLGLLAIEQQDVDAAMDVLHRALTIAMEINAKPRVYQANLALSEAHALAGDYENALSHYKIYQQVREEVLGDQAASRLRNMQINYETEQSKREAEISRLKNVELREKNEQLQDLLRELKEAETQLVQKEKMAALGNLIAGVVHEMNTPLGAMNSVADTVARCIVNIIDVLETADTVDEVRDNKKFSRAIDVLRQSSRISQDAVERLSRVVGSLKSFIRLDEASYQEVDIHDGLDSTITLLEYDFSGRIDVTREYGEVPLVRCYPSELNQVFMNLLTNAGQAIDGKGAITVRTHAHRGYVRVEFADTGVGIPSAQLVNIFEPIISKKGHRVKAGMGLFTAYNIIQKHHGNIEVMSEVGAGTTFTVIIPVDEEKAARSAAS